MAEQKFLGQEGTDVLVEKVRKNAGDILLQIPRSAVVEVDIMNKKTAVDALYWLQALNHGSMLLCKGLKIKQGGVLVKSPNDYALLCRPIELNTTGENYLLSVNFTASKYEALDDGATISFGKHTISCIRLSWEEVGKTLSETTDPNSDTVVYSGGSGEVSSSDAIGHTFVSNNIPYIIVSFDKDLQIYSVIPLGNGSIAADIQEITAQEVSDKFNS